MSRMVRTITFAAGLMMLAGPALASVDAWWAVNWASGVRTIQYKLDNWNSGADRSAGISGAMGREYATQTGTSYTQYAPVFCVDVFNYASDNWSNRFAVERYTDADGETGWRTPTGDSDEYREAGGLARAAALANRFGRNGSTVTGSIWLGGTASDRNDRAIALNVAIWKASYGSNFHLRGTGNQGNMTANQWNYYDTYYRPYYETGATSADYMWWDSKVDDGTSQRQDFLRGTVPEPSSVILLGGLLAGSALLAIRRRKQTV